MTYHPCLVQTNSTESVRTSIYKVAELFYYGAFVKATRERLPILEEGHLPPNYTFTVHHLDFQVDKKQDVRIP